MRPALALLVCLAACVAAQASSGLTVKVALLQMMPSTTMNQTYNTVKAIDFCQEAAAAGADIALFPEMYNVGPPTELRERTAYALRLHCGVRGIRSPQPDGAPRVARRRSI